MNFNQEYDDAAAVAKYMQSAWTWHLTEFERRCLDFGARWEKLTHKTDGLAEKRREEWNRQADESIRSALSHGYRAFEQRVRDRIFQDFLAGRLLINRCPKCGRVARTPKAQQCFWCGHDWHEPPI